MEHADRSLARRCMIVIALVVATVAGLLLIWTVRRVLGWLLVAVFVAVALCPAVDRVHRRITHRWLATLLVFLAAFALLATVAALIVVPLTGEVAKLAGELPRLVEEARTGRGRVGDVLERLHLRQFVASHSDHVSRYGDQIERPALTVLRAVVETAVGTVTVAVLAYLMVLQAPRITAGALGLVARPYRARVSRTARECARTVTGYLGGNLLISVICGGLTFLTMTVMGVPYAGVVALVVAVADLIPLVGATLGAVLAAGTSFAHSPRAGLVVLVFFVVYQQVENHVLVPWIFARVVRLSPLAVLVSLLAGAELGGIIGALLAIPAAGVIRIVLRELRGVGGREPAG